MSRECETKKRLRETAIDLIWQQSYGALSVEDICQRAGAKKGSFYYFFSSKSELTVAADEAYWQQNRPHWDAVFSPQVPPLERLSGYCRSIYERQAAKFAETGKVCGCPNTGLGSELSTQDENLRQKALQIIDRTCKYLETTLRDAANEGLIERGDFSATAREIYAFVAGMILQAKIRNNLEILRNLKSALFRWIGAKESAPVN
ncbi:MAG: TetR/AcrR family transcriptional regulator [Chthoniobacteraceae bacterium]